jgi:hypothetical protein
MSAKNSGAMYFTGLIIAARFATGSPYSLPKAYFFRPPRKKRRQ